MAKTVILDQIAKAIAKECPEYKLKDIKAILDKEQDVVVNFLDQDQSIKWGKNLRFVPTKHPATYVYNGMIKQRIPIPARSTIKVVKVSRFKNLTKPLKD